MLGLNLLMHHRERIIKWLDLPEALEFREWLEEARGECFKAVRSSDNVVEIHRAQGRLEVLDKVLGLRAELAATPAQVNIKAKGAAWPGDKVP